MGVNMKVKLVYGVELQYNVELVESLKDEYIMDGWSEEYPDRHLGYLEDCYSGEWIFIGKQLQTSHDFRYDG